MEKIKEFFSSPKKTAILGLVGGILLLANFLGLFIWVKFMCIYELLYLPAFGFISYFIIIILRLYRQKGSIKTANNILMATYILTLIGTIFVFVNDYIVDNANAIELLRIDIDIGANDLILKILVLVVILLYFCNILLRKKTFVDNKVFAVVVLLYSTYRIMTILFGTIFGGRVGVYMFAQHIIEYIAYLLIIPYFVNYYNLLEVKNENGK